MHNDIYFEFGNGALLTFESEDSEEQEFELLVEMELDGAVMWR